MGQVDQVFFRTGYNYDRNQASDLSGLLCEEDTLTVQDQAEDADINVIVQRFGLTGQMPQNVKMPLQGDFTAATDYHTSLNLLLEADRAFMRFPVEVRQRFGHDPASMMAFLDDPANRAEAESLGLVIKPSVEAGAVKDAPSASPSTGA